MPEMHGAHGRLRWWSLVALTLALAGCAPSSAPAARERPYFDAALDVATWIRASALETAHGKTWPVDPTKPGETSLSLYSGSPGVVLFFLDLHRAGHEGALVDARAGADHLLAELPGMTAPGCTRAWRVSASRSAKPGRRQATSGTAAASSRP
jgi:hypothetical protein